MIAANGYFVAGHDLTLMLAGSQLDITSCTFLWCGRQTDRRSLTRLDSVPTLGLPGWAAHGVSFADALLV